MVSKLWLPGTRQRDANENIMRVCDVASTSTRAGYCRLIKYVHNFVGQVLTQSYTNLKKQQHKIKLEEGS